MPGRAGTPSAVRLGSLAAAWLFLAACGKTPSTVVVPTRMAPAQTYASSPAESGITSAPGPDSIAKLNLLGGLSVAEAYFRRTRSYSGFDAKTAERLSPDRVWRGDAGAGHGVITINHADGQVLIMSTASTSGSRYCVGVTGRTVRFGTVDAAGADQVQFCGSARSWPSMPPSPPPSGGSPGPVG